MGLSARQIAFQALMDVEIDRSYSNIVLDHILSDFDTLPRDRAFISNLFYGVLEKKLLLDYNISQYSSKPVNELDVPVLIILRMGLYQIFFMNSVPASAAVNESVKLCKDNKLYKTSGFVNGILRSVARADELLLPNKKKGKNKYLSIKYSCPEPLIKLWRESYGDELCERILSSLDGRPPLSARTNTLRITTDELVKSFKEYGVNASASQLIPDCIQLSSTGAVEELVSYKEGLFHIQDGASQLCCKLLDAKPGHTVIDTCSAPGGKSFTIAGYMENKGRIISCDLYEHRLGLVEDGAKRLGIDIIETMCGDMSEAENLPKADRILCDVPCSGLGIIRRKPELRYKSDTGVNTLPELQYKILENCAKALKSGGILIYSTCTLNPAENGNNIRKFLREHGEFEMYPIILSDKIKRLLDEPENELTLFPEREGTDGFFISIIRRK